jgi:uncharacterized membrane-anchored protein
MITQLEKKHYNSAQMWMVVLVTDIFGEILSFFQEKTKGIFWKIMNFGV